MPTVRGEFFENPWTELPGWGRGVCIRSSDDVDAVLRLIDTPGTFRRAVILENLSTPERRRFLRAIEGLGVDLSEFTDSDKRAMASRGLGVRERMAVWGSIVLAAPFLLARRLRGRRTEVFEITSRSSGSGDVATTT